MHDFIFVWLPLLLLVTATTCDAIAVLSTRSLCLNFTSCLLIENR